MDEIEFTNEQLDRIDEVENAAFEFIKVLTEEYDMGWDMSIIGELADISTEFLAKCGYKVRFPAIVTESNGESHIEDYYEN